MALPSITYTCVHYGVTYTCVRGGVGLELRRFLSFRFSLVTFTYTCVRSRGMALPPSTLTMPCVLLDRRSSLMLWAPWDTECEPWPVRSLATRDFIFQFQFHFRFYFRPLLAPPPRSRCAHAHAHAHWHTRTRAALFFRHFVFLFSYTYTHYTILCRHLPRILNNRLGPTLNYHNT